MPWIPNNGLTRCRIVTVSKAIRLSSGPGPTICLRSRRTSRSRSWRLDRMVASSSRQRRPPQSSRPTVSFQSMQRSSRNSAGWRYDVFVLGPPPLPSYMPAANEATEAEINRALGDADRLLQAGYIPQSVIAAWAAAESAMRHRLRSQGSRAGWGTPPRTMLNELVSSGMLSGSDFRKLEDPSHLRNVIVHGFSVPDIDPGVVPFLTGAARQLMAESNSA